MTRTLSFSPFFGTSIGFDRFDDLFDGLAQGIEADEAQPAYDIERHGEDRYTVTLMVPGFSESELNVSVRDNDLTIAGERRGDDEASTRYLYRGIGLGNFRRTFRLADYVVVKAAELKDGLLRIELAREVPEAQKPRKVEIRTKPELKAIENSSRKVA